MEEMHPGDSALVNPDCHIDGSVSIGANLAIAALATQVGKSDPKPVTPNVGSATNSAADIERLGKAAEQGDAAAQIALAQAYAHGNGIPQDYQQTNQWLRKAVGQRSAAGQYWRAVMYRDALGSFLIWHKLLPRKGSKTGLQPPCPAVLDIPANFENGHEAGSSSKSRTTDVLRF